MRSSQAETWRNKSQQSLIGMSKIFAKTGNSMAIGITINRKMFFAVLRLLKIKIFLCVMPQWPPHIKKSRNQNHRSLNWIQLFKDPSIGVAMLTKSESKQMKSLHKFSYRSQIFQLKRLRNANSRQTINKTRPEK